MSAAVDAEDDDDDDEGEQIDQNHGTKQFQHLLVEIMQKLRAWFTFHTFLLTKACFEMLSTL